MRKRKASPSSRKFAGIVAILSFVVLWAVFVASLSRFVWHWPMIVQALFYLFMGIVWIFPLKPLIRWSQTGNWKARQDD